MSARHELELDAADVARMTGAERAQRVHDLEARSFEIIEEAVDRLVGDREIVARAVLYSGGNDSTTLVHLLRDFATTAIHVNTGIGIEATRAFVRDVCASWGLPLIEKHPPVAYRDLVLRFGFPGPAKHPMIYARLKERGLDEARKDLGCHRSQTRRALYVAGIRREESQRRQDRTRYEADGSVVWVSPLAEWTKLDLNTYRLMHPDVPRNPVADLLEMSGECLCGAYAQEGELEMVGDYFPEVRAEIELLERDLAAACAADPELARRIPPERRLWGHGAYRSPRAPWRPVRPVSRRPAGRLCQSCPEPQVAATVNPRLTSALAP